MPQTITEMRVEISTAENVRQAYYRRQRFCDSAKEIIEQALLTRDEYVLYELLEGLRRQLMQIDLDDAKDRAS